MGAIARIRHPWLERLVAAPVEEVRALVEGGAYVHPLGRAEPGDAAVTLLFGLSADDPAIDAFDEGALGALELYRAGTPKLHGPAWDRNALAALDLMRAIQRLRPRRTVADLHKRFAYWNNWAENIVIDAGLDVRREYWRALALTQDLASQFGFAPRRLLPFWLNICGDAGKRGRYDGSYLTVGLLGLRRLPLGEDEDANEEAAVSGLARWAAAQRPSQARFRREWRVLEGAFPRDPSFWTRLVSRVIGAVEVELFHKTHQSGITFPAAQWWREDIDLGDRKISAPVGEVSPPDASLHEAILEAIDRARPYQRLQSQIAALIGQHERYASRTGDTFFLVRTACNIGRKLLMPYVGEATKRAEKARDLALLVLRYEPFDVYAWSLWRDSLAALGQFDAAELVGWESVRRFPENPWMRNLLALLLSEQMGEGRTAEALLRETIRLFPQDVVCRTQLASIVGREIDRQDEASSLVRAALKINPDNLVAQGMLQRLEMGLTTKPPSRRSAGHAGASSQPYLLPADIVATARARRALFRVRQGDNQAVEEVRRLFHEDENLAYARYVAAAAGVIESSVDDPSLPTAFLAASKSAESLTTLQSRAFGSDSLTLSIAGAALGDEDAAAKVRIWLDEPVNDNDPRAAGLHALAARPASSLPTDLLADLLAASLGTALAA